MNPWDQFTGVNAGYVYDLYERYQRDPGSVDEATRTLFANWSPEIESEPVPSGRDVIGSLTDSVHASSLAISLTEYEHRDFSLVDVCAAGTTKGTGLAAVAELLGIARDEVMAVGDNFNDQDMLSWAGVGVVMGNAAPALLEMGFTRTTTNDECGLARAIREFAL